MQKTLVHYLFAGAFVVAALPVASPAMAEAVACRIYQPGMLGFLTGVRPAPCAYQGDYIAKQGPTYDGPAVIAPQPTYSPSRTVGGFVHGPYRAEPEAVVRRTTVTRVKRVAPRKAVVSVKDELPPSKGKAKGKGKVEIVRAQAEVRIYGPDRMEIRLNRR